MSTAREIITDALIEIGAIAQGETPDDGVMTLGLGRLQKLIDAWGAEYGTIAVQDRTTFVLTSGTSTFTIGPTGALVTARPVWIEAVNYVEIRLDPTSKATAVNPNTSANKTTSQQKK